MEQKLPVKVIPHNRMAHPYCPLFIASFGAHIRHKMYNVFALTFGFVSLNFPFASVLKGNEQCDHPLLLVLFTLNRCRKCIFEKEKSRNSQPKCS